MPLVSIRSFQQLAQSLSNLAMSGAELQSLSDALVCFIAVPKNSHFTTSLLIPVVALSNHTAKHHGLLQAKQSPKCDLIRCLICYRAGKPGEGALTG